VESAPARSSSTGWDVCEEDAEGIEASVGMHVVAPRYVRQTVDPKCRGPRRQKAAACCREQEEERFDGSLTFQFNRRYAFRRKKIREVSVLHESFVSTVSDVNYQQECERCFLFSLAAPALFLGSMGAPMVLCGSASRSTD
jgi:hypothetical protein